MKLIIGILNSMFLLSSCRLTEDPRLSDAGDPPERRDEIGEMLRGHYSHSAYEFDVRGPLPIAQFHQELLQSYGEYSRFREGIGEPVCGFEDSGLGKRYERTESKCREGDELYFFRSEQRSWGNMEGKEGYVLVRGDAMIDLVVTAMN